MNFSVPSFFKRNDPNRSQEINFTSGSSSKSEEAKESKGEDSKDAKPDTVFGAVKAWCYDTTCNEDFKA